MKLVGNLVLHEFCTNKMAAPMRCFTCQKRQQFLFAFYAVIIYSFPVLALATYDFYSFTADDLQGREIPLEDFRGKVTKCYAVH